jgi:hypothetical protein
MAESIDGTQTHKSTNARDQSGSFFLRACEMVSMREREGWTTASHNQRPETKSKKQIVCVKTRGEAREEKVRNGERRLEAARALQRKGGRGRQRLNSCSVLPRWKQHLPFCFPNACRGFQGTSAKEIVMTEEYISGGEARTECQPPPHQHHHKIPLQPQTVSCSHMYFFWRGAKSHLDTSTSRAKKKRQSALASHNAEVLRVFSVHV